MARLARLVDVYTMLKPCLKELVHENCTKGVPVQRAMFLHYEDDPKCYEIQYQYLLGPDVAVAPVYLADQTEWPVYLPEGEWVHLWTGKAYGKGEHTVPAPLGDTPVFYKKDSPYAPLFAAIRQKHGRA